jgi:hypothetical protein
MVLKSCALTRVAQTLVQTYLGRDAGQRVLDGRIAPRRRGTHLHCVSALGEDARRLVSVGRYALRGVGGAQHLFTFEPGT